MLISQSVGSEHPAPPAYSGLNTLRVEGRHFVAWASSSLIVTVTGYQSVQQTGSYVCIIITANPIIMTKIINYLNSKLNWTIFNSLTTALLFSPINRRFLMIRHFCHPGFQNIDHPNDI